MKVPNLLPLYSDQPGARAARRLFVLCLRHQGGGTQPLAEFLVSLYNSTYSRPNMYLLCRRVDDNHFEDVISVMTWFRDVAGLIDIHTIFGDEGDLVMTELMEKFGLGISHSADDELAHIAEERLRDISGAVEVDIDKI